MSTGEWRPAQFTFPIRQQDAEPPVERWEELLRAERSFPYRLVSLVARRPVLRRLLGVPSRIAGLTGPSIGEREARAGEIAETKLAQLIGRVAGHGTAHQEVRESPAEAGLPPVGPLLDREVETALDVLTSMPFEEAQRRGWHLQPNHYYWPLNDLDFLRRNPRLWAEPRVPREIDWDIDGQMELAERLAQYAHELDDVREESPGYRGEFAWGQGFGGLDAYAYYGLLRELQPPRIVEVGIGVSSLLMARALKANETTSEVKLIDPGPPWHILGDMPSTWQVHSELVQNVDLEVFSNLRAGDVLFYDGSHCVRTASDVNWMLFEVLPRVQPGVWVHIHDLSWPRDYGKEWIFDEGLSWNEQYFVQAFLMHASSYRVRLASVMLHHQKGSLVEDLFPGDIGGASSLWLEKVA